MNKADKNKYFIPMWNNIHASVLDHCGGTNPIHWFEGQIGLRVYSDYLIRAPKDDFPLSDELRELFVAMTGPHWLTVLRVYQIKKGIKHADSK